MVLVTRSKSSCPVALTGRLNSSSASMVLTFTGKTFPDFFFLNMVELHFGETISTLSKEALLYHSSYNNNDEEEE